MSRKNSPQFVPQSRLIMVLGASGIGECDELVMPKDGRVLIKVVTEMEGFMAHRKTVKAGTSIAITDNEKHGRIFTWNVRYLEVDDGA